MQTNSQPNGSDPAVPQVVCLGELLYRLGAPGREVLLQSPQLQVSLGGAEANVAIALAGFGHRVGMATALPRNALGDRALAELRQHDVDTSRVLRGAGRMALYFLETGAIQRPSDVLYDRVGSTFATIDPQRFDFAAMLAGVDLLHVSGVTPALSASAAAIATTAARVAAQQGTSVVFDGNYRQKLWDVSGGDAPTIIRGIVESADTLFADHRDIDLILGLDGSTDMTADSAPERAAAAAFSAFPRLKRLASTVRGSRSVDHQTLSAVMFTRHDRFATETYPVDSVVDRIGGGDAFAAGVLHGLLTDMDDASALHFGLATACLKHSVPGDFIRFGVDLVEDFVNQRHMDVRR